MTTLPSPVQPPSRTARIVRVPLAAALAVLVLGIVAGRYVPVTVAWWVIVAGFGLAVAICGAVRLGAGRVSAWGIAIGIFGLAACHVSMSYRSIAADHVIRYIDASPTLATVRGRIVTSPMIYQDSAPDRASYPRQPRTSFLLDVAAIRTSGGWQECSGVLRVTINEAAPKLFAGADAELVGKIGRFRAPDNPGQFDWSDQSRANGVLGWFNVPVVQGATVLAGADQWWGARAWWRVRSAARQHWAACGEINDTQLVNALIIGERHPALNTLNQAMIEAGVAHYLSISGSHLAIFLGFVYLLCRLATLSPRRSAILVLCLLAVYMMLAEPQAPLFRSAIMAGALCIATIFRRQYSALNAVCLAGIILLLIEPLDMFSPSFQLSFGIVLGMIVLHEPIRDWLFGRWRRRRGLNVFRHRNPTVRWLCARGEDWVIAACTMAVTATLVSTPLVAYHFSLFSPYAALTSLVLAPFVTAVLVPGYLSLALAWPMPNLSHALGGVASLSADGVSKSVAIMQHLPGLCIPVQPPGVAWILAWYSVLGLLVVRRRVRYGTAASWAGGVMLVALTVLTQLPAAAPTVAELNVLSVGAGQCVLLRCPSGATFIIDAGTQNETDAARQVLLPFIADQRLPYPSAVFVSHANTDHYNAVPELLHRRAAATLYTNAAFPGEDSRDAGVRLLLQSAREHGTEVRRLVAGDWVQLDSRTRVEVLWPRDGTARAQVNDTSLVLRVTCDDRSVIIPGDIEQAPQASLTAGGNLQADAMLLPHHGSWQAGLPEFVRAIAPRYILTSAGRDAVAPVSGGEAAKEFVAGLRTGGKWASTRDHGWLQLRFGRGELSLRTMR